MAFFERCVFRLHLLRMTSKVSSSRPFRAGSDWNRLTDEGYCDCLIGAMTSARVASETQKRPSTEEVDVKRAFASPTSRSG
jgi:hypothetical protein